MNGELSGTSGREDVTKGGIPLRLYLFCLAVVAVVAVVNISSVLIETPPAQRSFDDWEPYCWEISSAVAFAVLLPGLYWVYRRYHWSWLPLNRLLMVQAGAWLGYTAGHVAIMVALRHLTYGLMDGRYDFSRGNLLLQLIYEGRKDALTCALMGGIFWVSDRLQQTPQPVLPARIAVKSDGHTLYLEPAQISHIEAAGNYVELHGAGKPLLVRGTLADYQRRLSPYGFVRIHRSRLLHPAHVASMVMTSSGDVRLTLVNGTEVMASRRYRQALSLHTT